MVLYVLFEHASGLGLFKVKTATVVGSAFRLTLTTDLRS